MSSRYIKRYTIHLVAICKLSWKILQTNVLSYFVSFIYELWNPWTSERSSKGQTDFCDLIHQILRCMKTAGACVKFQQLLFSVPEYGAHWMCAGLVSCTPVTVHRQRRMDWTCWPCNVMIMAGFRCFCVSDALCPCVCFNIICFYSLIPVTHTDGKFGAHLAKVTVIGRTRHDEL